jgi:hypothetical protein
MYTESIGTSARNRERMSEKLERVAFNSVRKVLPDSAILRACEAANYPYRKRKITPKFLSFSAPPIFQNPS